MDMLARPRRLRLDERVRNMTRETRISKDSLIYPIFVEEGKDIRTEIATMLKTSCFSGHRLIKMSAGAGLTMNAVLYKKLYNTPKKIFRICTISETYVCVNILLMVIVV